MFQTHLILVYVCLFVSALETLCKRKEEELQTKSNQLQEKMRHTQIAHKLEVQELNVKLQQEMYMAHKLSSNDTGHTITCRSKDGAHSQASKTVKTKRSNILNTKTMLQPVHVYTATTLIIHTSTDYDETCIHVLVLHLLLPFQTNMFTHTHTHTHTYTHTHTQKKIPNSHTVRNASV